MTEQAIINPHEIFSQGINWGMAFDLPNNTVVLKNYQTLGGFRHRNRNRRDIYQKMELIIDSMGYHGKDCILKALCETGVLFNHKSEGFVEKIIRIIFRIPIRPILSLEPEEHCHYQDAHLLGRGLSDPDECSDWYSKCTFSLIDLALGFYTQNIPSLF